MEEFANKNISYFSIAQTADFQLRTMMTIVGLGGMGLLGYMAWATWMNTPALSEDQHFVQLSFAGVGAFFLVFMALGTILSGFMRWSYYLLSRIMGVIAAIVTLLVVGLLIGAIVYVVVYQREVFRDVEGLMQSASQYLQSLGVKRETLTLVRTDYMNPDSRSLFVALILASVFVGILLVYLLMVTFNALRLFYYCLTTEPEYSDTYRTRTARTL